MKKNLILNSSSDWKKYVEEHDSEGQFDFGKIDEFQMLIEHGKQPQLFLRGEHFPRDRYHAIFTLLWRKRVDVSVPMMKLLRDLRYPLADVEIRNSTYTNKISTVVRAHALGMRVPKTVFMPRMFLETYLPFLESQINYPLIMKDLDGKKGQHNFLVTSREEIIDILADCPDDMEFIFQEFIPNDFDYRLLVLGYSTKLVYLRRRKNNTTHLNNLAQGGEVEKVPLEHVRHLLPDVENLCRDLGRSVCGIDILKGHDGLDYFLEANQAPGIQAFDAAEHVLSYLKSLEPAEQGV
jgi:gamma-F420-2:alpha-L-glutamate ligase